MSHSSVSRTPRPAFYAVIALLFLGTGASGLVYQVVWQRYFLNTFGATLYSVSAVLAAFMGGLALGSWLLGARAEKMQRPLRFYGVIEILVAAAALLVPYALHGLQPLFQWAYDVFGQQFVVHSLVKFVFVFLLLLVPTTLMGATLPVLARFATGGGLAGAGGRVGFLYAANTFGAVAGSFLSGFVLIRTLGISGTVYLAAGVNVAAGVLSLLLSAMFERGRARQSAGATLSINDVETNPRLVAATGPASMALLVMAAYGISGFTALSLEVVWSRALIFCFDTLKNTTYAFTAMLTTYLAGIAIGSALIVPFVNRIKRPLRTFAMLQVLIGIASILSFFLLFYIARNLGDGWIAELDNRPGQIRWNAAVALVFLRTAVVLLVPTILMGVAFPVAVRALLEAQGGVSRSVGRLYAINTLGAIIGSAATGFLFLPYLGIANTITVMGALQLGAGLLIMHFDKGLDKSRRVTWTALAAATVLVTLIRTPRPAVFQDVSAQEQIIHYEEGPLATVGVVQNSLGYRTITVDNVGVAGTDPMLLTDQKSLAHVPMLFLPNPKSALTVGFGSGGASYSYTLYPEMERIDCVEITRTVPEAAPYLQASNRGIIFSIDPALQQEQTLIGGTPWAQAVGNPLKRNPLWTEDGWYKSDPRYNIILDDARSYLRYTDTQYDIIATDCTDLRYKSNANLYDEQYFSLCRDRITPDGMVVVWMPLAGLSDAAMKVALRTFHAVFPNMEVFYLNNQPTHYILLLGTLEPLKVDMALVAERLRNQAVAQDLREIYLADAAKLISCRVTGGSRMVEYLAASPVQELNTEDNPYLEFESPRFGYGDDPILDNLDELYKYAAPPEELASPESGDHLSTLSLFTSAVPEIIAGHRDYRLLKLREACAHYMKALEINPSDSSVKDLLNFEELRRKAVGQADAYWAKWMLAEVLTMQGRDNEAVSHLNDALEMATPKNEWELTGFMDIRKKVLQALANIYTKNNQPDRATQYQKQADQIIPRP